MVALSDADLAVILKSYAEVLDATKHQDEKVGRFLTAIAFLTTGAVALGTYRGFLQVTYSLEWWSLQLPAIALMAFMLLALTAVLLLVLSLGPNISLPRAPDVERQPSPLYFLAIARDPPGVWAARWNDASEQRTSMYDSLKYEIHNLATKTDFKYGRTSEARAAFALAVVAFAVAVALGVNGILEGGSSGQELSWDLRERALTAGVLSVAAVLFGYDYLRLQQSVEVALDRHRRRQLTWLYVLTSASGTFVAWVVMAPLWPWLDVTISLVTVFLAHIAIWCIRPQTITRALLPGTALLLGTGTVVGVGGDRPALQVLTAVVAVALLELRRALNATQQWRSRVRPYREYRRIVEDLLRDPGGQSVTEATRRLLNQKRCAELKSLRNALTRIDAASLDHVVLSERVRKLEAQDSRVEAERHVAEALSVVDRALGLGFAAWRRAGVPEATLKQAGLEPRS